jgi:hypothetical protein
MRTRSFQYLSGLTVLLTHVLAVAIIATATRFSDIRDQIGSILIVVPITLVYASAFIRYVVANATPTTRLGSSETFDPMAAATMYLVVAIFCASLLYVVIKFAFLSSYQVNEFKMWLGAAETAFGALIGIVFERLFGVQPTAPTAAPHPSSQPGGQEAAHVEPASSSG